MRAGKFRAENRAGKIYQWCASTASLGALRPSEHTDGSNKELADMTHTAPGRPDKRPPHFPPYCRGFSGQQVVPYAHPHFSSVSLTNPLTYFLLLCCSSSVLWRPDRLHLAGWYSTKPPRYVVSCLHLFHSAKSIAIQTLHSFICWHTLTKGNWESYLDLLWYISRFTRCVLFKLERVQRYNSVFLIELLRSVKWCTQ